MVPAEVEGISARLYVGNLPYQAQAEEIDALFAHHGIAM